MRDSKKQFKLLSDCLPEELEQQTEVDDDDLTPEQYVEIARRQQHAEEWLENGQMSDNQKAIDERFGEIL